ncbi:MAG: hypothetical protein ACI4ON_00430 [Clostridia bacterium]
MEEEVTIQEGNPDIAMKATLEYAKTLIGNKTKIAWVQNIGQLVQLPDGVPYSAIDKDEEYMAKGKKKAEAIDVEILFTHKEHNTLKKISDNDEENYFFIKYPEVTAEIKDKPLVFSFKGNIALAANAIEDGELLKDTIRIFKKSKVVETDGYPVESDSTKY